MSATKQALEGRDWAFIDPTIDESYGWFLALRCSFCGSRTSEADSSNGRCYCRYCDSCSSYWKAATTTEMDEGRPHREDCPQCREDDRQDAERSRP